MKKPNLNNQKTMKQKTKKTEAKVKASRLLPMAIVLAGLLNPGTPWRD